MGDWRDFIRLWAHHPWERALMFVTFILTVVTDLGAALSVGIGLAMIRMRWERHRHDQGRDLK